jgi:hypothetical protein
MDSSGESGSRRYRSLQAIVSSRHPRRRGVRREEIGLDDGSMDVYRKRQQ